MRASTSTRGSFMVVGLAVACQGEPVPDVIHKSRGAALRVAAPAVTVALTFDDTLEPQLEAAAILEDHDLAGTFYLNSPRLHEGSAEDDSEFLSIADARGLEARGHEVGGHTLSHLSLPTLERAEAEREIGNDRRELLRLGLRPRSLAYPFGDAEDELDMLSGVLRSAGYASARDTNGFNLDRCSTGPESLPPDDAFLLRSVRSVNNVPPVASGSRPEPPDSADTLLGWLDRASICGGGLLPLIFHELRNNCNDPRSPTSFCFDFDELDELAGALSTGQRCHEVDGDDHCYDIDVASVSAALGSRSLPAAAEVFAIRNASLERTNDSGNTECMQRAERVSNTARFARSTELAHSGRASEHMEIAAPFVAPAELRITRDFGACALFATEDLNYDLSLFYRADPRGSAPTLRFMVYRLTDAHVWEQWTTSASFAAASPGQWVERSFTTPAVPEGTVALSFGLRLESTGGVSIDDFAIAPAG